MEKFRHEVWDGQGNLVEVEERDYTDAEIFSMLNGMDKTLPRILEDAMEGKELYGKHLDAKMRKDKLREELRKRTK